MITLGTYTWTNNNHVNGPTTYTATVTGTHAERVYYTLNGCACVSPVAEFSALYVRA